MRITLIVALSLCLAECLALPRGVFAQEPVLCGPSTEKDEIVKHKGQHPVPTPSPGKALVFVANGRSFVKSYQQKLAVNGRWMAVLKYSQYSFFEVDPGVLRLCWGGRAARRDDNYLLLTAQPDQTYYIRGTLSGIIEVDEAEGKSLLKKKDYVTFEVRDDKAKN